MDMTPAVPTTPTKLYRSLEVVWIKDKVILVADPKIQWQPDDNSDRSDDAEVFSIQTPRMLEYRCDHALRL
jgi:hypothetical protein